MNKQALKHIDKIANVLPKVPQTVAVKRVLKGDNPLLQGQKLPGDQALDPLGFYVQTGNIKRLVDHKMRMKNAYKKNGRAGLIAYVRPFIKPEKFGEVQVFIIKNIP